MERRNPAWLVEGSGEAAAEAEVLLIDVVVGKIGRGDLLLALSRA